MSSRVLVGGGSGFIGKYLSKTLQQQNIEPIVISRNANRRKNFVSWDEIKSNGLPDNLDAVVNLAGSTFLQPFTRWTKAMENEIFESRVGTTETLKKAIMKSTKPPQTFICISGIGYYPYSETQIFDEDYQSKGEDFWVKFCEKWEVAGKFPKEFVAVRHVIVRSGIVLQKNGGSLQAMLPPFNLGLGGPTGSGTQWFPWIHMDDMCGIILHALNNNKVTGVLNGVSPESSTNGDFTKALGVALNRPAIIPVPEFAVKMLFGEPRADMLLKGQNVYPKRVLESGYTFKFPTLSIAMENIFKN